MLQWEDDLDYEALMDQMDSSYPPPGGSTTQRPPGGTTSNRSTHSGPKLGQVNRDQNVNPISRNDRPAVCLSNRNVNRNENTTLGRNSTIQQQENVFTNRSSNVQENRSIATKSVSAPNQDRKLSTNRLSSNRQQTRLDSFWTSPGSKNKTSAEDDKQSLKRSSSFNNCTNQTSSQLQLSKRSRSDGFPSNPLLRRPKTELNDERLAAEEESQSLLQDVQQMERNLHAIDHSSRFKQQPLGSSSGLPNTNVVKNAVKPEVEIEFEDEEMELDMDAMEAAFEAENMMDTLKEEESQSLLGARQPHVKTVDKKRDIGE